MIAILYALDEEVAGLQHLMVNPLEVDHPWAKAIKGTIKGREVLLVKSGATKVFSSITAQSIIARYTPSAVVLCGVSGGLHPEYERGDLVIGSEFIQHDIDATSLGFKLGQIPFTELRSIKARHEDLRALASFSLPDAAVHFGVILSGDQFIDGAVGRDLRNKLGGDVVDMESSAIALTCSLNQVPFLVARTISDAANESADLDFNTFLPIASQHVTAFIQHVLTHCFRE